MQLFIISADYGKLGFYRRMRIVVVELYKLRLERVERIKRLREGNGWKRLRLARELLLRLLLVIAINMHIVLWSLTENVYFMINIRIV